MGKCLSCGAWSLLGSYEKCNWCGKATCKKCLPQWVGYFKVKTRFESPRSGAGYQCVGFCSEACRSAFWQSVMGYPLEEIGTDNVYFVPNLRKLWYAAILHALGRSPCPSEDAIAKVKRAISWDREDYRAIPLGIKDDGTRLLEKGYACDFVNRAYSALARNLESCGRPLDAADIYEKNLKLYDKARQLRERDKHVIVKQTDITVNLNALLQQLKDGGIVALYRCPHCNGMLKVGKDTSPESLKTCQHCGAQIETVDLADFLKTALS